MLQFEKQPSFELGVVAFAMCAGCHPIENYALSRKNLTGFSAADIAAIPDSYPPEFVSFVRSLVSFDPGKSLDAFLPCTID